MPPPSTPPPLSLLTPLPSPPPLSLLTPPPLPLPPSLPFMPLASAKLRPSLSSARDGDVAVDGDGATDPDGDMAVALGAAVALTAGGEGGKFYQLVHRLI